MTEGGRGHEKRGNNDNTELCAYRLLECPICLEQMREPKSLPCLHSFCEECLGTYIVTDLSGEMAAATSFPCPVCRKITSPVDPSEDKKTWARQFPVNSLVQDFIYHKRMADYSFHCGPCKKTKNTETIAKFLCRTNDMLFCELCKENFHDVVHESCDIVFITETNQDLLQKQPIHTTCSTHNEKRDCYCEDHGFLGCNKCIITDHRLCDAVTSAKEYCEKQKKSSRLDDMDKSLKKAFDRMELMVKSIDDKGDSMRQCQDNSLSSILDLRQRINNYLDKKQEEITQDLISKYKAEKTKVDVSRQKCSRLRAAIQNTKEASRTAARIDDHIGMIQLFHRGQTEIWACKDLIDDISSSKSVSIKHDIDPSLDTIDQTSPLTLGTILVEEHSCTIPDRVEYVENHTMLFNSRVRKLKNITIKVPSERSFCTVHGVLLMSNGDIIISDYENENLKLFSCQGQCLDVLKINGYPHDMCSVDDSTVAVAVSNGQIGIHVMKVQDSMLTLLTVIKTPAECYGVAFIDGKFMVSTLKDIYRVGMEGESEKVDHLPKNCYHLASCPKEKRTVASMKTSKTDDVVVTKLSTGVQTCVMRVGLVKDARGIDVDRQRNLYVCGYESNNVVQMSTCGTRIRELLTSQDGIDKPRAISVCGDRFVVSNGSSQDRNNIHVYQLY